MDKYEQLTPEVSAEENHTEQPIVHVDERSGRNIIATGINVLSGLGHTSFEPIKDDELTKVIIPYHQ